MGMKEEPPLDSQIFAMVLVIAIGRISPSTKAGGNNIGSGVILAVFHCWGTTPCLIDVLSIAVIGEQVCQSYL